MLHLEVPPQSNPPGVDTRPGPLVEWIERLPYADTLPTAQLVLARLRDINAQRLAPRERHVLMNAFQQAYNRLHEPLRTAHVHRDAGHLESRELRLLEQLTEQMLHGYKYIILQAQDEKSLWRRPRHLHGAVNHALHLIVLLLASRYADYIPTEQRLWKEAAELLDFSELKRIPEEEARGFPFTERLGADRAFRQLAVLRLSDPFRLPPERVWDTLAFISEHIDQVRLEPGDRPHDQTIPGCFPLCRDCEPNEKLKIMEAPDGNPPWRQIDLENLIITAQSLLARLDAGSLPELPGDRTVREQKQWLSHLIGQWMSAPQRRHERRAYREITRIRCGLSEVWRLHNRDRPFDPAQWQPEDDWMETEPVASERPPREYTCTIDNRSAGGLGLRYPRNRLLLQVGDLVTVAVPDPDHGRIWYTAIVRWVMNEGGEAAAGLQYVAREARAVAARPVRREGEEHPCMPVLVGQAGSDGSKRLLISPRGLYAEGRPLELYRQDGTERLRCERLIEVANGVERILAVPEE